MRALRLATILVILVHASLGAATWSCALVAGTNAPVAVTRGPYLQMLTPTSVLIRWRTNQPTAAKVRYGAWPDSLTATATSAAVATDHTVALRKLEPGTRYFYSVETNEKSLLAAAAERSFVTPPPAGTAGPTRIWVIGDAGTGNDSARRVRDAYLKFAGTKAPDVWLLLGDNAYPNGTDADHQRGLFDMFKAVLAQTAPWPAVGNHDATSSDPITQRGPYFDVFTLPTKGEAGGVPSGTEAYYSFDHANVHFVVLDSQGSDRSRNGAMLRWLERDLAAATAEWIIAYWHHPPYSRAGHNSDMERRLVEMRTGAVPILEKYGADLILAGHSHSYERSRPLRGHYGASRSLTPAMVRDRGNGRPGADGPYHKPLRARASHVRPGDIPLGGLGSPPGGADRVERSPRDPGGTVYVVVGSSGQTTDGPLDHPVMATSLERLGSLVIDIDGGVLRAAFIDAAGAILDRFEIVKQMRFEDVTSQVTHGARGGAIVAPPSAPAPQDGAPRNAAPRVAPTNLQLFLPLIAPKDEAAPPAN